MKNNKINTGALTAIIGIILICALVVTCCAVSVRGSFNDTEYIVTVTDKERVYDENGSKYLVFTEDSEGNILVFENTDNMFRGKFDSSDMQGELKERHTYKITAIGYRISFLSMYQNIIAVEEVTDNV